jgi:hypothetical protein
MADDGEHVDESFDGSFEGTRWRQILLGLAMTPHERLQWLEKRMAELRGMAGKAGRAPETEKR